MNEQDRNKTVNVGLSELAKEISNFNANVSQILNTVMNGLSSFKIDFPIEDIGRLITLWVERHADTCQKFSVIMVGAGWPPLSQFDLYLSEMESVVTQYVNDASSIQAVVDEFVMSKYDDEKIVSLLNEWKESDWLKKRIPIIQEIVESHIQGKYCVAIPALLPQIEGIITERFGHTGNLKGENYKNYAKKILNDKDKWSFDKIAEDFLLNVVLVTFEHGNKLNSSLSRHAILHGADVRYGTKANSIKCIMLFDYLQNKFDVVITPSR